MTSAEILNSFGRDAKTLLDGWCKIRRGGAVADQANFDPMQLPGLLPRLWIYRYDPEINDFVCRLAGEDINTAWGRGIRGATLSEIVGKARHAAALARWRAIIDTPRIQHGVIEEQHGGEPVRIAERLVMPLSWKGGPPDRVLGFSNYLIRQTDHDRTPPVWDNVNTINCADL